MTAKKNWYDYANAHLETDVFGDIWMVKETREIKNIITFHLGNQITPSPRGGCRIIITEVLRDYMRDHRPRQILADLEGYITESSVTRIRKKIKAKWIYKNWWIEREGDLRTLTLAEFVLKHGCSIGAASMWRDKLINQGPPEQP